jgi:hypothetical protein
VFRCASLATKRTGLTGSAESGKGLSINNSDISCLFTLATCAVRRSWHGREAVGARLSCARPPAGQHMRIEILSSPVEPRLMLASPLDPATGALIVGSNVRLAGRPQERAAPTISRPCPDHMHRKRDDRGCAAA